MFEEEEEEEEGLISVFPVIMRSTRGSYQYRYLFSPNRLKGTKSAFDY